MLMAAALDQAYSIGRLTVPAIRCELGTQADNVGSFVDSCTSRIEAINFSGCTGCYSVNAEGTAVAVEQVYAKHDAKSIRLVAASQDAVYGSSLRSPAIASSLQSVNRLQSSPGSSPGATQGNWDDTDLLSV